jgi:hypothetical protein
MAGAAARPRTLGCFDVIVGKVEVGRHVVSQLRSPGRIGHSRTRWRLSPSYRTSSFYLQRPYLGHSFPIRLFEPFTDSEGNFSSRPVYRDGQPIQCRNAVARRERLIERLASLAPVQGALDPIAQRFGTEMVAEVTGCSRWIVRRDDRFCVENRAGSANRAEAPAKVWSGTSAPTTDRRICRSCTDTMAERLH